MRIRLILLVLITAGLFGCENQPKVNTISGNISDANGQSVSLIGYTNGIPDTLRNVALDPNGNFELEFKAGRPDFYTLALSEDNSMILILDSTNSNVQIDGSAEKLRETYSISGSEESERLRDLLVITTAFEKELDSLMTALRSSATTGESEKRVELGNSYNQARQEYRDYLIDFINSDPEKLANFTALQRLNMKEDLEHFKTVRDALSTKLQGNYFFDNLSDQIASMENQLRLENLLEPGTIAPEIALPNPAGDIIKLTDLRGNYVLIDFWASWCKPCRMENPNVVRMYKKYENENFEIFGVSLDRNKEKWIEAIAKDKLEWPHVSDLRYWQSAAADLYNVKSIPFTVLIDPEGKVIATKLRGAALEQKLDEIFNT
ncbi:TlpA disulfide reductase family protein [Cryomorphaceae bacterium 1068]|nr:TlpA disulfide reductase family protein [Cryomorphaceae bacterium 1068]